MMEETLTQQDSSVINIRKPIKVLQCSDGIFEIFADDEETETKEVEPEVNEKELNWTPWFAYKAQRIGQKLLNGIDYTGEKLADFLNLSGPKYSYEIQQYMKEQQRIAFEERTLKENTWKISSGTPAHEPITTAPKQSLNINLDNQQNNQQV